MPGSHRAGVRLPSDFDPWPDAVVISAPLSREVMCAAQFS